MLHALVPLADLPPADIEALLDRAFGSDRHMRTAYRVRAGTRMIASLSFGAVDAAGAPVGCIQAWPVALACDGGGAVPMVMIGPVAVEPAVQRDGIGRSLTLRLLAAAEASDLPGCNALMLIGDPEYYARFFGFSAERTARWRLPGPFEPRRLLARGEGVPDRAGEVGPRCEATA